MALPLEALRKIIVCFMANISLILLIFFHINSKIRFFKTRWLYNRVRTDPLRKRVFISIKVRHGWLVCRARLRPFTHAALLQNKRV